MTRFRNHYVVIQRPGRVVWHGKATHTDGARKKASAPFGLEEYYWILGPLSEDDLRHFMSYSTIFFDLCQALTEAYDILYPNREAHSIWEKDPVGWHGRLPDDQAKDLLWRLDGDPKCEALRERIERLLEVIYEKELEAQRISDLIKTKRREFCSVKGKQKS